MDGFLVVPVQGPPGTPPLVVCVPAPKFPIQEDDGPAPDEPDHEPA